METATRSKAQVRVPELDGAVRLLERELRRRLLPTWNGAGFYTARIERTAARQAKCALGLFSPDRRQCIDPRAHAPLVEITTALSEICEARGMALAAFVLELAADRTCVLRVVEDNGSFVRPSSPGLLRYAQAKLLACQTAAEAARPFGRVDVWSQADETRGPAVRRARTRHAARSERPEGRHQPAARARDVHWLPN